GNLLQCLKRSMVGRVALGLEASSFSTRCFVLHCLALTREALGRASKSASSLLLLLALALIHVLGHCPSSRSPVLLSLSFTCSLSSPIESARCGRPFLIARTRPCLRLLAQSTNKWRRVTEHGWPA